MYVQMFSNAAPLDWVCIVLGTFGGIVTGLTMPAFNVLFGRMLNKLNDTSGDGFAAAIEELCYYFIVLAGINVVSGFLQVSTRPIVMVGARTSLHSRCFLQVCV
jgi:hypothetical protein